MDAMQTSKLTVNEKVFLLASTEEGQKTRTALAAALKEGGGFVELRLLDRRTVNLLLSTGVVAVLEDIEVADDDDQAENRASSTIYDWDYFPELEA